MFGIVFRVFGGNKLRAVAATAEHLGSSAKRDERHSSALSFAAFHHVKSSQSTLVMYAIWLLQQKHALMALERCRTRGQAWAGTAVGLVCVLSRAECSEVPKPTWWSDAGLLALTAQILELLPGYETAHELRGKVLLGPYDTIPCLKAAVRSPEQLREACRCYKRAAEIDTGPDDIYLQRARYCIQMSLEIQGKSARNA